MTQTESKIFHYDLLGHLIAETNQSGQMLAEYVYLGDHLLSMIKPGENAYYFHNDHLGTPQVLTDDTQAIAWKATYTPFGEAVASIDNVDNPFRFPGQYYDQETGLHYNYFRYYNPQTGRYITPDPIGLEGGINLFGYVDSVGKPSDTNVYTYVANNPIGYIDPFGLARGDWWDPRTYVQFALSWSSPLKGTSTSGRIEQETMTFFQLVGGSFDIYIGKLPSPCERSYELGFGLGKHLGVGYFYSRPDILGDYQDFGLVFHIGLGVGTPIYFTSTEPANLGLRTPMDTYLEKGRK